MPLYEYACDPCETIFKAMHGINAPRPETCPRCTGALRRVVSAPNLNLKRFTSPTEAKYANLSESDEVKIETQAQKVYNTIWMPEEVKHSPWDRDH